MPQSKRSKHRKNLRCPFTSKECSKERCAGWSDTGCFVSSIPKLSIALYSLLDEMAGRLAPALPIQAAPAQSSKLQACATPAPATPTISMQATGPAVAVSSAVLCGGDAQPRATIAPPLPSPPRPVSTVVHSSPGTDHAARLALDFGTAMSKVAYRRAPRAGASVGDVAPIGGSLALQVPSLVGLSDEGFIFFGDEAVRQAEIHGASSEKYRIFRELKLFLTRPLEREKRFLVRRAGKCSLDAQSALALFIGHLVAKAKVALGTDIVPVTNYTLPVDLDSGAALGLRRMLERGHLVDARLAEDVILFDEAMAILDASADKATHSGRASYIGRDISEPVAALFGADDDLAAKDDLYLCVDSGAGTTDVACVLVKTGRILRCGQRRVDWAGSDVDAAILEAARGKHKQELGRADIDGVKLALATRQPTWISECELATAAEPGLALMRQAIQECVREMSSRIGHEGLTTTPPLHVRLAGGNCLFPFVQDAVADAMKPFSFFEKPCGVVMPPKSIHGFIRDFNLRSTDFAWLCMSHGASRQVFADEFETRLPPQREVRFADYDMTDKR